MQIGKQDVTFLIDKKVNKEGKSYSDAYSEINNLKGFEYDLTIKNKTIETLKERLNKANEKIIELTNKLGLKKAFSFKDKFKELQKSEELKEKSFEIATTKDLQRVLNILSEGKINLNELTKTCGFKDIKIRDNAIKFLSNNKIIKIDFEDNINYISLNSYERNIN